MSDPQFRHPTEPADTDSVSLGLAAYTAIRRDILTCRLVPGSMVTEGELMATYGFGKNSCRIALTRLAHERLVFARPRKGYQVAPITLKDVEEVFALRVQLEPMAARLAVNRVDTQQLHRLEAACRVEHIGPLPHRIDVFMDANKAFHLAIAEATGNERLLRTLSGLMDEMSRLVALGFNVQRVKPEIRHDHNSMIKAFEDRDERAAETIARRHIETFRTQTMEKVYASLSQAGTYLPLVVAGGVR
ncbi:GntR family transcriptional regulator [Cupriavidus pampae]|uniref:HTH-type transcriptional repressor RspR n=1 Tax=Cupriavidus pampae TaxID=659251 RepID=A0ABN7YIX3_9BURK|nr:GntR family transcriptional regulator [Cupriavidus pampae]CAG9173419.1 HTH-type transcriptional repressor RspR [Cupriavidus pampae]